MKRIGIVILLLLCVALGGCMTWEERAVLDTFPEKAAQYYTAKYGEDPDIVEADYYYTCYGLPQRTDTIYGICQDGTVILYQSDDDLFLDNRQERQITEALEQEFEGSLAEIEATMDNGRFHVKSLSFSYRSMGFESAFFHHYFDGDVKAFLEREDVRMVGNLWLICDREDSWQQAAEEMGVLVEKMYRGGTYMRLAIMDETCHSVGNSYPDVALPGCHGVWEFDDGQVEWWIQEYIPLVPGLYATSNKANFRLEEGDIRFIPAITEAELNELLKKRYKELPLAVGGGQTQAKSNTDGYGQITAVTPIYRVEFSQRVTELFGDNISVYLLFCPEEAGLPADTKYWYCPEQANIPYCYVGASNSMDACGHILRLSEYQFIGWQTVIPVGED